jgi:Serine/threonine protein kinase
MSPEQCRGQKLGPAADIYSMGCLMYDVLTGSPPIVADNINEALLHQIFKEPTHINATKYGVDVPKMLQGIIMKSLRKDPAMRYQSAAELRSYLDAVQS